MLKVVREAALHQGLPVIQAQVRGTKAAAIPAVTAQAKAVSYTHLTLPTKRIVKI